MSFSYKLHSVKGNDFMYIIWWIFTQVCICEITTLLPIFFLTFRSLNSLYQIWPSFSLWFLGLHPSLGRSSLKLWWKYNSFFPFSQFSVSILNKYHFLKIFFKTLFCLFVLRYSRLTMLWKFQVKREGTQPYIHMNPFSPKPLPTPIQAGT